MEKKKIMKKMMIITMLLLLSRLFADPIITIRHNYIESSEVYGISDIVTLHDKISFPAKVIVKYENNKNVVDFSRVEFGMVYDNSGCKLINYDGSFLVTLSTEKEDFKFIANLGENALYLDGDDYQVFNIPDFLFNKDLNVTVKMMNPDFPKYIHNVFFYICPPRK